MPTVYFATNRVLTGADDALASYSASLQPPSDPTGILYGNGFVDGVDVARGDYGAVTALNDVSQGRFSPGAIDDLSHAGRDLLVFIHGFDNSFSDALTCAEFNRQFLAQSGDPAAAMTVITWSWPSLGQIVTVPILQADYLRDQTMARNSGLHLMSFLANLQPILAAARAAGKRAYLLVHSMGNLALQAAVENWFLHGNGNAQMFDTVFLAAGDCGANAFALPNQAGLSGLPNLARRIVIYYSHADQVLQLSAVVNLFAQRLGQDGPINRSDLTSFPPSRFTMIDATVFQDYDVNFLTSHQYYRLSPSARADIVARL